MSQSGSIIGPKRLCMSQSQCPKTCSSQYTSLPDVWMFFDGLDWPARRFLGFTRTLPGHSPDTPGHSKGLRGVRFGLRGFGVFLARFFLGPWGPQITPKSTFLTVFIVYGGQSRYRNDPRKDLAKTSQGKRQNLASKMAKPRRPPGHCPDTHRTLAGHSPDTPRTLPGHRELSGTTRVLGGRRDVARIPSCFIFNQYFITLFIFKNDSFYICFRGKVVWAKWPKGKVSHRPKCAGAPRAARAQVTKGPRAPRAPRAPLDHAAKGHKYPSQMALQSREPQSPRVVIRCA